MFINSNTPKTAFGYIAKEFLLTFVVCFFFFFAIFFVNQILFIAEDILQKNAPLLDVLRLMVYAMPSFIALSIPFASLVAALLTMGKFSSDNEIIAFQASGISISTLFVPMICLGLVFSVGSFIMNDILLPIGTINYTRLYRGLIFSNPELELEPFSVQKHQNRVLVTGHISGKSIDTLLIIDNDPEGNRRIISGRNAELIVEEDDTADLSLSIATVFSHSYSSRNPDTWDYADGEQMNYRIPLQDITDMVTRPGAREMSSVDVWRDIQKRRDRLEQRKDEHSRVVQTAQHTAISHYWSTSTLLQTEPQNTRQIIPALSDDIDVYQSERQKTIKDGTLQVYEIEFHKKFAIPAASIAFVIFAFPVGLFSKRSGRTVNFGIGLIICVFYWFMLLGGQTLGTQNHAIPPVLTMWVPNIILILFGLITLLIRIRK